MAELTQVFKTPESIKKGSKFCSECGSKQEAKFCPKCGARVKETAKFCTECGEKLK